MSIKWFKYLSPFFIYYGAILSFLNIGPLIWLPLVYSWILIPLVELFTKGKEENLTAADEELAKRNRVYDILLYLVVPFQYFSLALFLYSVSFQQQSTADI